MSAETTPRAEDASARALRWAGAFLTAALVSCLFYSLDRTRAALGGVEYDPTQIISTRRIDYFWRITLSGFLAAIAGAGWFRIVPEPRAGLRWLTRALIPVGVLCAVLSMIWP